jgi:hypothetical protein
MTQLSVEPPESPMKPPTDPSISDSIHTLQKTLANLMNQLNDLGEKVGVEPMQLETVTVTGGASRRRRKKRGGKSRRK